VLEPLLGVLIIFGIAVALLLPYSRRVIDSSLTSHFRAAESISEGHLPAQWAEQIDRRLRWQRLLPASVARQRPDGTALALAKLEKLSKFFSANSFFENAETKAMLLEELETARRHWETMSWEELRNTVPP
jgi:hypothetical protein